MTPTKMKNPGTRLGASVAFAFNSPAQGPVTSMGFEVTYAGNRTQNAWILSKTPEPRGHRRLHKILDSQYRMLRSTMGDFKETVFLSSSSRNRGAHARMIRP